MLELRNMTKQDPLLKKTDFLRIQEAILGKKYELSLVFVGNQKSQQLNRDFRNKSYTPNILSFPLDKMTGEIFINLKKATSETKKYNPHWSEKKYITFLFIHSCLHLKGFTHGEKMEKEEQKFLKKFI